jgi:hypothetical protein
VCGRKEAQRVSTLSTTTDGETIAPIHPGEVLMEDFIEGFAITQNKFAVTIGVPLVGSTRSSTGSAASLPTRR